MTYADVKSLDNNSQIGPIFVVGSSRSGTTMMGRILGRHPFVFTFEEIHFFEQFWSSSSQKIDLSRENAEKLAARLVCIQRDGYLHQKAPNRYLVDARNLTKSIPDGELTSTQIYAAFLRYEVSRNNCSIACKQTPQNVFYIDEILKLYPDARFINMVRDPRDVLLSQKRKWKRRFLGSENMPIQETFRAWANYHPITISVLWNSYIEAAERLSNDKRVLSVRFEDLLTDPEVRVRKICTFCGLDFDRSMLEVPQIGSSTEIDVKERLGINRQRANGWTKGGLTSAEILFCQLITHRYMNRYGYSTKLISLPPPWLILGVISFFLKLAVALVLNLKKTRNIGETLKRHLNWFQN